MTKRRRPAAVPPGDQVGGQTGSGTGPSGVRPAAEPAASWSPQRRGVVSALLAFHLFVVVLSPLANPIPSADFSGPLARFLSPYINAFYLGHGYRFFAPNPGPTHIVRYEITRRDGSTVQGHFPDRNGHWPRLMYHRWFMLSETIFEDTRLLWTDDERLVSDSDIQQRAGQVAEEVENLRRAGQLYSARQLELGFREQLEVLEFVRRRQANLVEATGRHLLSRSNGIQLRWWAYERLIPLPGDVVDGLRLDSEQYLPRERAFELRSLEAGR